MGSAPGVVDLHTAGRWTSDTGIDGQTAVDLDGLWTLGHQDRIRRCQHPSSRSGLTFLPYSGLQGVVASR
jgi:hypothetical protein